jgi:acyl carrier protein
MRFAKTIASWITHSKPGNKYPSESPLPKGTEPMNGTKQTIKTFIVNNFTFGDETMVTDTDSFLETGIIDSTGILELVDFLEKEFNITIDDDELIPENLESIEKIEIFLQRKCQDAPVALSN